MKTFAELETERPLDFKNPDKTPDQLVLDEKRRQAQREHEAKHTRLETDEERTNTDEYPEDNQE